MVTATAPRKVKDPTTHYARAVVGGKVVAGHLVRLAAERHLRDLKDGQARGLSFDLEAAARAIQFFGFLRLAEGEFAGRPFILQPWQQFIVGSLFGWKGPDGYRRFAHGYIECGKGNGKTPLLAGIGLYGLVADGEPGAEIYSAAVTRDQAGILFADAKKMVAASPLLSARIENLTNTLALRGTTSFFRPISSEARSLDGKRVHMALIDEVHEHRSDLVINKMRAGLKGRRQPLILEITNSGYDRTSVCWQHHDYSDKVLRGLLEDDAWFAFVCGLDEKDDWRDERVWLKANPNLGTSVTVRYLRQQVTEALGMPAKQNIVRRLNFCQWTEQSERWIDLPLWDKGAEPFDPASLKGRPCFGGLDLAWTRDMSALALLFPPQADGERWKVIMRYWCPEEGILERSRRDGVPYEVWARQGLLVRTPGNATDFDFIEAEILELASVYQVREIAFDRMFAGELVTHLTGEGLTMVAFGQGFYSMAAPCAELERLVLAGKLQHGAHPILNWNVANAAVSQDPAGNKKPDKAKSTGRIDGLAATIMALGRAIVHGPQGGDRWPSWAAT